MNTLGKVFFGMVCITLLFSCNRTKWVTNNATIKWDVPTKLADGSPIPSDQVLRYKAYIDIDDDNNHNDLIDLTEGTYIVETSFTISIAEKSYTISFDESSYTKSLDEHKGRYFIGIQTLTYKIKDGEVYGKPNDSEISWSSSKSSTKKAPFGIKIK